MPKNPTNVEDVWTAEDEAIYRPLRRKILRIDARRRKDKAGRVRRYGARRRKSDGENPKEDMKKVTATGQITQKEATA